MSLGEQYVSNFVDPDEAGGLKAELELVLCRDCRLLQLRDHRQAGALAVHDLVDEVDVGRGLRAVLRKLDR